jgi:hypothetical protein
MKGGRQHRRQRYRELPMDLSRRIGEVSCGNRQKIGLIQALLHEPELLILDEPTEGLDPQMQEEFLAVVAEERERGATLSLSSHELDEARSVRRTPQHASDHRDEHGDHHADRCSEHAVGFGALQKPRAGWHPCGVPARALDEAGYSYEIKVVRGQVSMPWTWRTRKRDRAEVGALSGENGVSLLVLDDGGVVSGFPADRAMGARAAVRTQVAGRGQNQVAAPGADW